MTDDDDDDTLDNERWDDNRENRPPGSILKHPFLFLFTKTQSLWWNSQHKYLSHISPCGSKGSETRRELKPEDNQRDQHLRFHFQSSSE